MFMRSCASALLLLVLAGAAFAQSAGGQHYRIDLAKSDLHWLVYKAGTLSRFGHNHVISVGQLTGDIYVAPTLADSRFEMKMPVAGFVVDNPELRAKEGAEFETQPSDEDIKGTRHNMLGDKVLDAERYPILAITGTGPIGTAGSEQLQLIVTLRGRTIPLTVPTQIKIEGDTLEASGKFQLTHEQLGLTPFSVFLGALQVADKMDFAYHVVAHRVP